MMVRGYSGTVDYDIMATYGSGSPPVTTTTIPSTTTINPNDTTPPTGTVIINNGLSVTNSQNVILTLYANDGGTELTKAGLMTFSNDNQEWSDPEPYTAEKFWTLSAGEGSKTVYVKFRDAAGNWMAGTAQDQIIYDESANVCLESQKLPTTAATVSSQFLPFFSKDNAIDGDPTTSWSTLFSFFKRDEFITLDLGDTKRISWLTMQAASSLFGTDYFPVNFKIEVSNDTIEWQEISSEQGYALPIQSVKSDSWNFESVVCRYIRVYISKAKAVLLFFKVAQIAEIEVYGCDIPPAQQQTLSYGVPLTDEERGSVTTQELSDQGRDSDYSGPPSTPGKPVITFQ